MSEIVTLSTGAVIRVSAIASILPRGEYPDEVTLVMKNGDRHFAGSGYNKTAADSMKYWKDKMSGDTTKEAQQ